jgi:RNA polymerase primary sigma factor
VESVKGPRRKQRRAVPYQYDPTAFDGLLWKEAKRWLWATRTNGIELRDLVQAGYSGLAIAATMFEEERGLKFSTYAMWWVRAKVKEEAMGMARTVRVPALEAIAAHKRGAGHPIMSISLDEPGNSAMAEAETPEEEENEDVKNAVAAAMHGMPDRLRQVVHMRFFRDMKLNEIGLELGVTRERARQLEAKALERLRERLPCNPLQLA